MASSSLAWVLALSLGLSSGACEDVSHENIDKWGHTEKGPGKLMSALESSEHSAELRAHAAQKLIEIDRFGEVKEVLEGLEQSQAQEIMASLATRLWEMARINDAMSVPTPRQTGAKDALFYTMDLADSATQAKIADYLVEWYVGGHYEGRAKAGRVSGSMAMRKVGEAAAERLLNSARGIVSRPPDDQGRRTQVGDELLRALALTGNADALRFLLELMKQPRGDKTLPKRAVGAIYFAFVEPLGFEPVDGKALLAVSDTVETIPYDPAYSPTMRNDAVALMAAIGAPECIPMFTRMITYPSEQERYRWMGTQHGIRCAGLQGIEAITEALPAPVDYERGMLSKYLWDEILKFSDKQKIAEAAARLLRSESWVARVTGIELLGELASVSAEPKHIELIKSLNDDSHRLKNWWGAQDDVPKKERKKAPTIGQIASNVAKSLERLASGAGGK